MASTDSRFEGMTWDGKNWTAPDPETGEPVPQKLTIWQKSKTWERVFMLVVFGGAAAGIFVWWTYFA